MARGFLDEYRGDERGGRSNLVDIKVMLVHQTDRAYLVRTDDTDAAGVWVPKSVAELEPVVVGGVGILTLSKSMAQEKGLA